MKEAYYLDCNSFVPFPFQSNLSDRKLWNNLRKLCIPPKIRLSLWCVVRDLIPTQANLASLHVVTGGSCFLCKFHHASTSHSILFCMMVRHIWKNTIFWASLKLFKAASFFECVVYIINIVETKILNCILFFVGQYGRKIVGVVMLIQRRLDTFRLIGCLLMLRVFVIRGCRVFLLVMGLRRFRINRGHILLSIISDLRFMRRLILSIINLVWGW